jgi:hypothetical protein
MWPRTAGFGQRHESVNANRERRCDMRHFRYYQIRGGEDTFKGGMKLNSEIDMAEFDFGRNRVEERFLNLKADHHDRLCL